MVSETKHEDPNGGGGPTGEGQQRRAKRELTGIEGRAFVASADEGGRYARRRQSARGEATESVEG